MEYFPTKQKVGSLLLAKSNPLQEVTFRSLYIPTHDHPYILEDTYINLKMYAFSNRPFYSMSFQDDDIVVCGTHHGCEDHRNVNFFASSLIRSIYPLLMQQSFAITGPILFFGIDDDFQITSVPRKVIDYCMNLIAANGRYKNGNSR